VIQEFLRQIAPIRDRLERIILFGSRARGDHKPYSDYDILIVLEERDRPIIDTLVRRGDGGAVRHASTNIP
jgi:predicted nucleotidyltransferase